MLSAVILYEFSPHNVPRLLQIGSDNQKANFSIFRIVQPTMAKRPMESTKRKSYWESLWKQRFIGRDELRPIPPEMVLSAYECHNQTVHTPPHLGTLQTLLPD